MRKIITSMLAILTIAGCQSTSDTSQLEMTNVEINREGKQLRVVVDVYRSVDKFIEQVWSPAYGLKGQSMYEINGDKCHIKVLKSKDNDLEEVIGHEVMHCLYGDFHSRKWVD